MGDLEEENQALRAILVRTRLALRMLMATSTFPYDWMDPELHRREVTAYDRAYDACAAVLGACAECGSELPQHGEGCAYGDEDVELDDRDLADSSVRW